MGIMARRFQFSVPGNRGPSDPWFRVGNVEVTTTVLVTALAAISFFIYAIDKTLLEGLVLFPSDVRSGQVWRLLTWPLVNPPSIWNLITLAIFWWFGRDLEAQMGRVRFLWFLLAMTLGGGLLATLLNVALAEFRYIELGTFVAFAAEHARARFMFNIPAWVIAAVIVGLDVLQLLGDRLVELLLVELFILAIALVVSRSFGLATDAPWIPKIPLGAAGSGSSGNQAKKRTGKGKAKLAAVPSAPRGLDITAQMEMDVLLDKISAGGVESLSSAERKRLDQLSKQLRGK